MARFVLHTLALLTMATLGCGPNGVAPCFAGKDSCACYANGTCNVGLSCEAQVCVPATRSQADPQRLGSRDTDAAVTDNQAGSAARSGISMMDSDAADGGAARPQAGNSGGDAARMPARLPTNAGSNAGNIGPDAGSQTPSDSECAPRESSVPHSAGDPCKQRDTACSALGGSGVAECGSDGLWQQCICELPSVAGPLPRKNAEPCVLAQDCASGICEKNSLGEAHCYGTAGPNEACRDVFDCRRGSCIGRISDTVNAVCVDGVTACDERGLHGSCTEELAIAACQLDELCDAPKPRLDFNSCVRHGCAYWHDNPPPDGCEAQLSFARGGKANCSKQ